MAIEELTDSIVEPLAYFNPRTPPAIPGLAWYDTLAKYAPEKANEIRRAQKIDWHTVNAEWAEHCARNINVRDLNEAHKSFWKRRGGRALYFTTNENNEEVPNEYMN